jgi:hypothetical protein
MPTGPGHEAAQAIANAKRVLRGRDVRAIALVIVEPSGNVGTIIGGIEDGHAHQLSSGIEILRKRFNDLIE